METLRPPPKSAPAHNTLSLNGVPRVKADSLRYGTSVEIWGRDKRGLLPTKSQVLAVGFLCFNFALPSYLLLLLS